MKDNLDQKLTRIEERVGSIDVSLVSIAKDLERNTDSLQEHMRRTDLLETGLQEALLPIKWLRTSSKVILILGAIFGILHVLSELGVLDK